MEDLSSTDNEAEISMKKSPKKSLVQEILILSSGSDPGENNLGLGTDSEVSDYEMKDKDFEIEKPKKQQMSSEEKLRKRYKKLIGKIDRDTDEKLNYNSWITSYTPNS